jgi:hypothetical protein
MPPHTASEKSPLDLLSNASFSSTQISIQSSKFTQAVEGVIKSAIKLTDLVDQAMKLTVTLASHKEYNKPLRAPPKVRIKLDRILTSMLYYAYDCGGEGGKRYTASAIYSCRRQDNKETLENLQSLATTWLYHLLFTCKWKSFIA